MSPKPQPVQAPGLDLDRTMKQALRLHQKGRLEQAEKRYTKILSAEPAHAGALHLMGVLAHQAGHNDEAADWIRKSLAVDPDFSDAYFNLALIHEAEDRIGEAEACYRHAIDKDPKNTKAHLNLGNLLFQRDDFAPALECYNAVLALAPADSLAHKNRSRALRSLKDNDESLKAVERAVELRPDDAIFQLEYANALRDDGQTEKAAAHFEIALRIDPNNIPVLCNLGGILKDLGRRDEAQEMLERAIEIDPDCAEAYVNLANLAFDRDEHQNSVDMVEAALAIRPNYAEAYSTLGRVFGAQAMHDEAFASFQKAVELDPKFAEAYVNLGSVLQTIGRPDEALRAYEIALNLKPKMDMAYWNLALALLSVGRLDEGWSLFGYGFTSKQRAPHRPFPGLLWEGEDTSDKTLFVWREQGLGDDLRFSSVYHDLAHRSKKLIIETDERLVPLYQRTWPNALVRPETHTSTGLGNMREADVDFDVTAPAGMAASYLRGSLDLFPTNPSPLVPDPEVQTWCRDWLESLGPGPKIGIAWRSSLMTKTRALYHTKITDWADLLQTSGVTFVNLQYDVAAGELEELQSQHGLTIHQMPDLDLYNDLDGAAALTSCVDAVVTSPTSVAEMAGALHRPTFCYVMSAHPMQLGTDHLPWFPNTRLYSMVDMSDHGELVTAITKDVLTYLGIPKD
jgi:tetratricopeptide (TPR) repeat protein